MVNTFKHELKKQFKKRNWQKPEFMYFTCQNNPNPNISVCVRRRNLDGTCIFYTWSEIHELTEIAKEEACKLALQKIKNEESNQPVETHGIL